MLTAMSRLRKGESGTIKSIEHVGNMRRRLIDIGFSVGERVTLLSFAPLGEPSAFYIKGSVIALRRADAERITIITEEEDGTDPKQCRQGNS